MSEEKKYAEPWVFQEGFKNIIKDNTGYFEVADCRKDFDAIRIVDCVNAMQGIADPIAWVMAVKNLEIAALKTQLFLEKMMFYGKGVHEEELKLALELLEVAKQGSVGGKV